MCLPASNIIDYERGATYVCKQNTYEPRNHFRWFIAANGYHISVMSVWCTNHTGLGIRGPFSGCLGGVQTVINTDITNVRVFITPDMCESFNWNARELVAGINWWPGLAFSCWCYESAVLSKRQVQSVILIERNWTAFVVDKYWRTLEPCTCYKNRYQPPNINKTNKKQSESESYQEVVLFFQTSVIDFLASRCMMGAN